MPIGVTLNAKSIPAPIGRSRGVPTLRRCRAVFGLLLPVLAVAGCGHTAARDVPPLIPDPARARAALDRALQTWTGPGGRSSQLQDGSRVELVDRRHAEGRRPGSYRVLGALREDWARGFVVELTWPGAPEPATEQATYLVAGAQPLWVMRRDDIDLLMHWEHAMEAPADTPAGPAPSEPAIAPPGPAPAPVEPHHLEGEAGP